MFFGNFNPSRVALGYVLRVFQKKFCRYRYHVQVLTANLNRVLNYNVLVLLLEPS